MSCGHRASKKAVQNGKDRATKANAADDFHHVCMSMSASTGEYGLCTGTDCVLSYVVRRSTGCERVVYG